MARPSHPRPARPLPRLCPHTPKQLLPVDNAADWGSPPALHPRPQTFPDSSWVLSTHIIPAALPRTIPDIPPLSQPAWTSDKKELQSAAQKTLDEMLALRHQEWNGELKGPGNSELVVAEKASTTISATQLVTGDLVLFHTGYRIPADIQKNPSVEPSSIRPASSTGRPCDRHALSAPTKSLRNVVFLCVVQRTTPITICFAPTAASRAPAFSCAAFKLR